MNENTRIARLAAMARAALLALVILALSPVQSWAQGFVTLPGGKLSVTPVTLPTIISASSVIGPQSIQYTLAQTYSDKITVILFPSFAEFVPTITPSVSGLTGCTAKVGSYSIFFEGCTSSGGPIQISGLSYTNAAQLSTGKPIQLSVTIQDGRPFGLPLEDILATTVVAAPAYSSATYTLAMAATGNISTSYGMLSAFGVGQIYSGESQSFTVPGGTLVTLTATPRESLFGGWSGGCTGTALTCQVFMDGNKSVTGAFNPLPAGTYALTADVGLGAGTVTPVAQAYPSGAVATVTATADKGWVFARWDGACTGTAPTCQVTMNGNKNVTAIFTQITSFKLSVTTNGTGKGTVTTNPNAAMYDVNTSVLLTATPAAGSTFAGWSGGCTATALLAPICSVGMTEDKSVTATFTADAAGATLRQGGVFSSASAASQSFFRFYNAGSTAGTVTVSLSDYVTGQKLGDWTSPSIAPGTAPQYGINTLEAALPAGTAKPSFYMARIVSQFAGTFQHVLYKPSDGTLTNLSTCDTGTSAIPGRVANVHASVLGAAGFPSSLLISNTGTAAAPVSLAVSNAATGARLGTYTSAAIPADGQLILTVSALESAIGLSTNTTVLHYVATVQGSFTGYLQHLVNNTKVGVTTDMSVVCQFPTASSTTQPEPNP